LSEGLENSRVVALAWMTSMGEALEEELRSSSVRAFSVASRVKSVTAVSEKLKRVSGPCVNDFIGFRVVLRDRADLAAALASVEVWGEAAELRRLGAEDRFESPGIGGYRALHLDFALADPEACGLSASAGIEVQLTTAILAAHAAACHELIYHVPGIGADPELAARLHELGQEADRLDRNLAALRAGPAIKSPPHPPT
jgi:ppGpp synthetase/RelA/SpoT-type nucleotidyltranferase